MNLTEKMLKSQLIFDGKVLHVYKDDIELPNKKQGMREYIKHIGAVCVVPITDDGKVILVKQYRYAVQQELLEIPAGKLDSSDEDPLEAAKRELREETGAIAKNITPLGLYLGSPAILSEKIHMYLATGLTIGETSPDEDEFIEICHIPIDEAVKMVLEGSIPDGKTQAGILRAYSMLISKNDDKEN